MKLKKKLVFLLLSSIGFQSFAQSDTKILTTVSYNVSYTKNGKTIINDLCLLDITKNQSHFYSKNVAEAYAKILEKFAMAKARGVAPSFSTKEAPASNTYQAAVLKNTDKSQAILMQGVGMQQLGYVKDPNLQNNWNILDQIVVVNGLKSQKAEVVKSDGTTVTAWFCKEIPLHDGPFSYFGLPGLITKLSTSDGWEAELTQIVKNTDPKKQITFEEYTLVSEADFKKGMENAKANRGIGAMPTGVSVKKQN